MMKIELLLVAAVGLLVFLVGYAGYLGRQLILQKRKRDLAEKEIADLLVEKDREARETIKIIANALLQGEMTDTEAAMRIAFFSQQMKTDESERELLSVFEQLAQTTAHMPILEDWKMLERSEKKRLTREREEIEARYSEFIKDRAEKLIELKP